MDYRCKHGKNGFRCYPICTECETEYVRVCRQERSLKELEEQEFERLHSETYGEKRSFGGFYGISLYEYQNTLGKGRYTSSVLHEHFFSMPMEIKTALEHLSFLKEESSSFFVPKILE